MKNKVILLLIVLSSSVVHSQIVNIPDANFKFTLVNLPCVDTNGDGFGDSDADTNDDGEIQISEAEAVQGLRINFNDNIESIEGIQSFINLIDLFVGSDSLVSFDLSQNNLLEKLRCGGNLLATLNLSQNINLKELNVNSFSQITELDLTQNTMLELINFGYSPLTNIELGQNPNLKTLAVYNTLITEIDISQTPNLEYILVRWNQLTSLDVSNLSSLREFNCNGNQITTLNVSNSILLEYIFASDNLISSLDLTQNHNLYWVTINNNVLTSLNLKNGNTNNISRMWAYDNPNLLCIQVDDINYPITQVCTSWGGWCEDETAVYSEDCSLGLEEVLESQISLYPNPIKGVLMINIESISEVTSIKVYDILGRLVLEQSNPSNQIDVTNLNSGLLFIQIKTEAGVITKKIIKE